MLNLFKKKSAVGYDSEYFRNKVKISELEEKVKVHKQRQKIKKLQSTLQGNSQGFGAGLFSALSSMDRPSRRSGKKRVSQDPFNPFGGGGMF